MLDRCVNYYKFLLTQKNNKYFLNNGKVAGIRVYGEKRRWTKRAPREMDYMFKVRAQTRFRQRPLETTVSIDCHGFDKAYEIAVEKTCEYYQVDDKNIDEIKNLMMQAKKLYINPLLPAPHEATVKHEGTIISIATKTYEMNSISDEQALQNELDQYNNPEIKNKREKFGDFLIDYKFEIIHEVTGRYNCYFMRDHEVMIPRY